MTKFDQVLSNDELLEVFASKKGSGDYNALDVMQWAQGAVLTKLHKQEPVAVVASNFQLMYRGGAAISEIKGLKVGMKLYAHPKTCVASMSDKNACVSQNTKYATQTNCQVNLDSSSHIPDASNMVWCACGDGFEPDTFGAGFVAARGQRQACDAEDKSSVLSESRAKIIAAANLLADNRIMAIHGRATDEDIEGAYKALELRIAAELDVAQENSNHIADMRKKVPEGWQLVPKEPTDAMLSCIMGSVGFESFTSWRVSASGRYMDMLATAPKFGDKQ